MEVTEAGPVLAHTKVTESASPTNWLYVVHGIFGAGRNWAAVAKRVVRNRPEWGALLIDLREHGASQGFPGPHTIESAAADIAALAVHTGTPPTALLGHSFGGKVSLVYARAHSAEGSLRQVWVIDSTPAAREVGGSAQAMLEILQSLPDSFTNRDELIAALIPRGVEPPIAAWMATNLVESDGRYRWRFKLESMELLLTDFFQTDAWDVVEQPPAGTEIHLVKATDSSLLTGPTLARVEKAADNVHTFLHTVEGGHWLNADNPDALVDLLTSHLPE